MRSFKDNWQEHALPTPVGLLEWTEFPGPSPFVGCTKLDGRNISPAEAHRYLVEVGPPAAELDYIGSGWG